MGRSWQLHICQWAGGLKSRGGEARGDDRDRRSRCAFGWRCGVHPLEGASCVMHLPVSAEVEGCRPCEWAVQEFEFGDETAEGEIS